VDAVLLSYHGTVSRTEDVAAFVKNIRRGADAPAEVVAEVARRLEHIGGSPLARISDAQAAALEKRLGIPVRAAARLWHPYPAEVLPDLAAAGVRRVVSLPLAPQSVHVYHPVVEKAAADLGLDVLRAPAWGLEPALIDAFATAIRAAAGGMADPAVVLTAHSLPTRIIAAGDPYERDFRAMAAAVSAALATRDFRAENVHVAFQSQGMGARDAWLGPDLEATFRELSERGLRQLIVAPIGFVAEHVETLYDIDIEARALAARAGFTAFSRMPALNDTPAFIDALETVARRLL
jgi:protoporphyrin/coproporphyrin ferrochelatase